MSLATILPNMRAAFRARLQTCVDIDVTVAVTAAGGVLTRAAGSWIDDRFAKGQEITLSGVGSGVCYVTGVAADKLTTSSSAAGTGNARVQAKLPAKVVYEPQNYQPAGVPYVVERVQQVSSRRRAFGPSGMVEHRILGHANLFYPVNGVTTAIEGMAGALMNHFRPGTALLYGGDEGTVMQVEPSGLMADNDWLSIAVTVTIQAFTSD